MAFSGYMKIVGTNGEIEGGVGEEGRKGLIRVVALGHSVEATKEARRGSAGAKRLHRPFRILKEVDRSSARLYQALSGPKGQLIEELDVDIRLYSTGGGGPQTYNRAVDTTEMPYLTVVLKGAQVETISFNHHAPHEGGALLETEWVSFSYSSIVWTWDAGKGMREAHDAWAEGAQRSQK